MASNLRVDNIQPSTGMGIGIGTANGSVTFNADVTGGLNVSTGLVGVGTDNPSRKLHVHSGSTDTAALFYSSDAGCYINYQDSTSGAGSGVNIGCSGDDIRFGSGAGGEYGRITSAGNLQINNGNLVFSTSGTGIDFSATADGSGTTTSEIFDDYEEGSWTPALESAGTPTITTSVGIYTKIGNFVHCTFYMSFTGATLTNSSRISGLPFAYSSSVEPNIFLSRVGQAYDSSASAGSRTAKAIGHTSSGITWIYVDVMTSGTAVDPRGEFVIRAA